VKLRTEQRYDPTLKLAPVGTTTPANDGFSDYKNTDYVGNIVYETSKTGAIITNRTRILVDGGYIENGVYHYYLADHLGNNRIVVNQSGTVTQKNHYYPFGMAFAEKFDNGTKQPYKYNDKELDQMHGLNLYDYHVRQYESAIGRFTTVDPLAEKYYSISPYVYCANNPMRYIDPTGMFYDDYFSYQGKYLGTDNSATDYVRVVDEGQYNLNKEADGSIDPIIGTSMSKLHSQSGVSTDVSLAIFEYYNPTGLSLKNVDLGPKSDGGEMVVRAKNGVLASHIDADIKGFINSKVSDHSSEIKNIFVHENKHITDFKNMGAKLYYSTPMAILEQRAVITQMADPTFQQMRPFMQNAVKSYGIRFGMSFDMKVSTRLNTPAPVSIKIK
jgi:RHS repeat-associated protein